MINLITTNLFGVRLRRLCIASGAALAIVGASGRSSFAAISVDGSLADWGPTSATSFTGPGAGYSFLGTTGKDDVWGPGGGGQPYDAEWMGMAVNGSTLYLAIVTGQSPANGASNFGLGDILLKINGIQYGIETGGSATGLGGVVNDGDQGAYFTLNTSGYTTLETTPTAGVLAGSIWKATQGTSGWVPSPISGFGDTQLNPSGSALKTLIGSSDYVYKAGPANGHSVIELAINLALFGSGSNTIDKLRWTPSCGNDVVELNPDLVVIQNTPVPEPASVAIWLAVGFGLAFSRVRRSRTASASVAS